MGRTSVDQPTARIAGRANGCHTYLYLAICLLLVACRGSQAATPAAESIDWEALPIGLGRGYLVAGLENVDNTQTGLQQGDLAPNFHLQLADGRQLSLHDLQGSPVLINFWATWCDPCRSEMPELVAAAQRNPNLRVLAVNAQEELDQIQPFAEDFQMEIPIVRDTDGALRDLYAASGMPTSVFIDKKGKIALVWPGQLNKQLLEEFLGKIE